jgi:type II secretory pathway pseudopilin PulG
MFTIKRSGEKGDTLIEVLVAMSILGLIVVGTLSIMNRGAAQMYDSLEKSEVRLLLNRQTESLVYARDQYLRSQSGVVLSNAYDQAAAAVWEKVREQPSLTSIPAPSDECANPEEAFFVGINYDIGRVDWGSALTSNIADGFPSPGNGIWIQKIDSDASTEQPYKDFYVRACWVQNSSTATQVMSTVVRLYDKK